MKIPAGWLKDFTTIEIPLHELCEKLTMSGSKVEGVAQPGDAINNVVTGRVDRVDAHPDADRLFVCHVNIGFEKQVCIVTSATNLAVGQMVPVALDQAVLPDGTVVTAGPLRGVMSEGMMCSFQELGLTQEDMPDADPDGILILPNDTPVGCPIQSVTGMDEPVIEFEITSNRPDCFSVEGIARETAATIGSAFHPVLPGPLATRNPASSSCATVHIEDPELCSRYVGRVVYDVTIGPSPAWLRQRLRQAGVRPVNNIVDITNYVMLEIGQPMHAFDMDRLAGGQITVRYAKHGETLRTLDGEDRVLDSDMTVIADRDKVVAVAGVMGGEEAEIQDATTTLLLEAACFNPLRVRLAAKQLGMRTEASSRFEKGLDVTNCMRAIDRACELIALLQCGTPAPDAVEDWPVKYEERVITFSSAAINALLGTAISENEMTDILTSVGCVIDRNTHELAITVIPPSWRPDLLGQADLAEEIARFYGYNHIPATLLSGKEMTAGGRSDAQKHREFIKDLMIGQGFYECCTYSFESPKVMDRMRLSPSDSLRKAIRIRNPLGEEYSMMRTSMFPSMMNIAAINWSRSAADVHLFEIGFVYIPAELPLTALPTERRVLSACAYNSEDDGQSLYLHMKGIAEDMTSRLGGQPLQFHIPDDSGATYLHPGKTAEILMDNEKIGYTGYIHPLVSRDFEVPEKTVYLEIDLDRLLCNADRSPSISPLPKHPSITRDLAVQVSRNISAGELLTLIRKNGGRYLESVRLFDVYQGEQIGSDQKSMAFSLVFQAPDRTMREEEITETMQQILAALEESVQARRR